MPTILFHGLFSNPSTGRANLPIDQSLLGLLLAQVGIGGIGGFVFGVVMRRIASLIIGIMSFLFVLVLVFIGSLTKLGIRLESPQSTEKLLVGVLNNATHALLSANSIVLPFGGSFSLGLLVGLLVGKPQSWI